MTQLGLTKFDVEERRALETAFKTRYPLEFVNDNCWPSDEVLKKYYVQVQRKNFSWVPWRYLLSRAKAFQLKEKKKAKELKTGDAVLMQLMAANAGIVDEESEEVTGSHYRILEVLTVRMYAMVATGHCHIMNLKAYSGRFMSLYTKAPSSASGMRSPSGEEAELADQEVFKEIIRLVEDG